MEILDEVNIKVKVLEGKQLKAMISLDFGDFEVRGFRIQVSQYPNNKGDYLWLQAPSYKNSSGQHQFMFYAQNEDGQWDKLQERIWEAYYKKLSEYQEDKEQWI